VLGAIIYVLQNDVDSRIRAKAARSLLFVRDERVIPALIEAIHDRDWDVRNSSRSTLRTIGSSAFEAVFIALRDSIQPLQLGPFSQAVPGTSELIHLLGDFEDERAVDLLVSYVASPNVSLKERAIASLGRIGSERATEPLIELTRDTDSNIRREAVCALCELGDERARERVISIVRDP
jgi:HEAT repeat protein